MKGRYYWFPTIIIFIVMISSQVFAQEIDSRIWSMHYWQNLANQGLVEVAKEQPVPEAVYTGSKINALSVLIDDSPDVPVTAATNTTQSENSIFVNPLDNEKALNSNNSTPFPVSGVFGTSGFMTSDFGLNWNGSVQGTGGNNSGDPAAVIDLNGRYYVGYIADDGGNGCAYSTDEGQTWTHVQVAPIPGPGGLADKNHLWVDNGPVSPHQGNLYAAWTAFGGVNDGNVVVSRSTDQGLTWASQINISSTQPGYQQGVNIKTGPDGTVYAAYTVYISGGVQDEPAIGMTKSTDGGATWETPQIIISNIRGIRSTETSKNHRVNSFPVMDIDISGGPRNGWIYVVWTNIGTPGVNVGPDIDNYIIRSSDGGTSWSTPVRINQDPAGLGKEHYFPWITCDPETGNLSVISYDDRNVSSTMCETFVANSLDGGVTWEDFKVSDVAFTPAPISGLASGYFGDYISISSRGGKVYPCWTDNRNGRALAYVSPFSLADLDDPNPPSNLSIYSDYTTPTEIALNWTDPTTLVNGDSISAGDFNIQILRDTVLIDSVAGGVGQFTDTGLNDGQFYQYSLFTKLILNDSTSLETRAGWTAGGAGQPNPPAALSIINAGGGDLRARWTNPATNIDGTTMDDLDAINLYEDGTLLTTFTRTTADTGRADSATFTPGGANLEYYVTAVDNETPANESAGSNSAYPPFSAPYAQDFEGATPGTPGTLPVQWTNQTDDDFDWNVDNGGTPSSNTGPTVDHTLGTAAGIYMYTETSSPITTGDVAHLTTPFLDVSTVTAPNLSFWYHMFGAAMGELHVDVYFNGMWNLDVMQPALVGQQQAAQTDPWRQAVVDLSPYTSQPIQLRFRGIRGTSFTSDMAIDDVVISSLQNDPQMAVAPTVTNDTLLVGDSTSHDITISNTQPLPSLLNYTVTVDGGASWITVDTDSGQVGPLASDVMVLSVNTIGLTAGNYSGTVTVAGNDPANPTDVITVNLVANEAPVVSVSPDSLHFTVNTAGVDSMMFTISNTGLGPLTFDLTDEDILGDYIRTAAVDRSYIRPEYNADIPKDQTDWRTGTPQTEGAGGPDIFGYKWIDSDEPGGPVFNFIDISSTGTLVTGLTDDNFVGPFPIGFTFSYYGNDYTDYYIGSNGMIGFGSSTGLNSLSNVQIPTAATPNNMIAWLWDDLDPGNPLTSVYYQTMGNMLVIQFDHYFEYPDGGAWVDAEMIIYANGNIKVQYDNFEPGFDLVGCTVGIENSDGTDGLQVVFNGAYLHDDLALLFYRESQWLSTNPTTGTVPPGGSVDIQAIVDAAGLFGGNYLATVIVNSNDPVTPELRSPRVSLTVGGLAVLAVTPDPVVFATTFVGATADQPVMVENTGTDTLRITNITSTESVFTVDTTNLVLDPLSGYSMTVMFDPLLPQVYSGWLVFESNTPTSPDSVAISGTGVNPPIMVLSPNFTNPVTVNQGDSTDIFINMSNTGGSNLLWTAAVSNSPVTSDRLIFPKFGPSQSLASADASPVQTLPGSHAFIEAPWDLQFSFDATAASGAAGNAGAEFDGTNYYTTRWASNLIHQYDLTGTMTLEFSIAGVTGLRDLAYDGALFYGGAAANTIFVMDFATQTLLGTISSPVGVRNISYDDGADGFWVGNWADPPTLIDRSGSTIATLTTGLAGQYGAAYDGWSDGGPYLWVFDQGTGAGFPQLVHQFDLNTLTATGFTYDVASDFPAAAGIAGGLWTGEGVVSGKVSIGGLLQGTPDNFFVYELTEAGAAWLRIIGANSGSIAPMDQFDLTARVYGVPADEDTAWVAFLTNDPALPAADVMVVRDFITGLSGLEVLPTTFDVAQNYPNPFNPTTTISYQVPEATDVRLVIYNVLGQRVRTLVNDRMEPGYHSVVWDGLSEDGRTVASGIYIYRFEASDFTKTLKLMLLK